MKLSDAEKIYKREDVSDIEREEALKVFEKNVLKKFLIASVMSGVLLLLSIIFVMMGGGRFTSKAVMMTLTIGLIVILFLSLGLWVYHKYTTFSKEYYMKIYKVVDIVQFVILAAFMVLFLRTFILKTAKVSGPSMSPTLKNGETVFVTQVHAKFSHDNIVVFLASPYIRDESPTFFVKRIKGMPGDTIAYEEIEAGLELYINDKLVQTVTQDTYKFKLKALIDEVGGVIPPKKFLLLGDNITDSQDSRAFGFVEERDLIGTVHIRLFKYPWILK